MDTISCVGYSFDEIKEATIGYIKKRTKIWRGVCWSKPDTNLDPDYEDEMKYQVGEILSCPKEEVEFILKLLKSAGMHFVFTSYSVEPKEPEEEDEEEFDDEGWKIDTDVPHKKSRDGYGIGYKGGGHRYVCTLSYRGLRQQIQNIYHTEKGKIFFPSEEVILFSEEALNLVKKYSKKSLRQIRFQLRLEIYYLIASCLPQPNKGEQK